MSPHEMTLLTQRDIESLGKSWKLLVEQGHQQLANKLLKWMFQSVSGMLEQFSKFKGKGYDQLDVLPEFRAHAQAVVMTIEAVIFIDQPDVLERKLTDLIKSHVNRKHGSAGSRLFGQLRDKIHIFIEQERMVSSDHEETTLWTKFFTVLVNICKREERKKFRTFFLCGYCCVSSKVSSDF